MRISPVPRNNSLFVDTASFLMFFCLQSNKPQFRSLLTSNLVANYHSTVQTTQNLSLLCTSTPSLSRTTPQTPFPIAIVRTTKRRSSLAEQFKSRKLSLSCCANKRPQLSRKSQISLSIIAICPRTFSNRV